jgi:hypothetical protein
LDVKELFGDKEFIKLDEEALAKLNNWISVNWNFLYEKWKELFVYDGNNITNVVLFDGESLVPKRRIYYNLW